MKKHTGFILFFSAAILIFLGRFIFMKDSFLYGDYLQQFYPWGKAYSEALKNFTFPFWIRYVNGGFPLMAEGQSGGFYPLNIAMFFLLPFNIAYNYSIILHFVLAGIFTYIYARKIGIDEWGAALSVLIFCFSSSFAGCPYLRTLAWFPLALFIIEKYFEAKKFRYILYLGIILGLQLLAGFVQMAAYSALFYLLYFFYGLKTRKNIKIGDFIKIGAAFFVTVVLSLPQVILSLTMANLSTRVQASLGFALWGSFVPLNVVSLCFPKIIIYGSQLYIGVFTIIFLIYAVWACKKETKIKPILAIFLVSFFLALGAYNPLYVLIVKITRIYGFRNPSKFLFFSVFSLAILSGWGFTHFFKTDDIKKRLKALRVAVLFIAINISIFVLISVISRMFKAKILAIGKWYVANYIFGKDYHRHYIQNYLSKVDNIYAQIINCTSISNQFTLISLLLCIAAIIISLYLIKHKGINKLYKVFFIAVIFFDLFIFSFTASDFGNNIKPFSYVRPTHNAILHILQTDKENFRVLPFALASRNMPWWLHPSANILVGIDSVASYTPLAQRSYRFALLPFEVVDDSLGLLYPKVEALCDNYDTLQVLNVKYVIAPQKLEVDFLEEIAVENGIYLYKIKAYLPRVFFISDFNEKIERNENAVTNVIKYSDGYMETNVNCHKDGFIVFSENFYPGWKAYVDGKEVKILEFRSLIQAVKVEKGRHRIIFCYNPF